MCNNNNFCAGMILGIIAGAAVSCFLHSQKGKKMMNSMCDSLQEVEFNAKMMAEKAKHRMQRMNKEFTEKINEQVDKFKNKVDQEEQMTT